MVSEEDLYNWEEVIKDFKELKNKTSSIDIYQDEKISNLISKVKQKNKNNSPTQIPQKTQNNIPSYLKFEKGESLGLDKSTDKKLKAGKYPIDIRIDLHGENLEDAYFKLKKTIDYAFEKGYRLILAITGKGLHSVEGKETIKSSLQNWLSYSENSSKIIKYIDAHKIHGGSGAVYILLRRNR